MYDDTTNNSETPYNDEMPYDGVNLPTGFADSGCRRNITPNCFRNSHLFFTLRFYKHREITRIYV
jgi:hypothetical protein